LACSPSSLSLPSSSLSLSYSQKSTSSEPTDKPSVEFTIIVNTLGITNVWWTVRITSGHFFVNKLLKLLLQWFSGPLLCGMTRWMLFSGFAPRRDSQWGWPHQRPQANALSRRHWTEIPSLLLLCELWQGRGYSKIKLWRERWETTSEEQKMFH
jgi:hypothetical protein